MTEMTTEERNTLVAAMSDKTAMGRLNAGEISACFDRMVELGYDIVKRTAVVEPKAPEKPLVAEKEPEPVEHQMAPRHRVSPKHKGDK